MIVSFSTIGYGDIKPMDTVSRMVLCILLILNITVMSNFLGTFTEVLFSISIYD